jgi:hypothetical protein
MAPMPLPPQMRDSMSFHLHIQQSMLGRARRAAVASGDPEQLAAYERMAASYELPAVYVCIASSQRSGCGRERSSSPTTSASPARRSTASS